MEIFVGLIIAVVFVVVALSLAGHILRWVNDNRSPVVEASATVVAKRTEVRGRTGMSDTGGSTWTEYYVTFEGREDGRRREFRLPGEEFGLLVEGDAGTLVTQGSRMVGFRRVPTPRA